MICNTTDASRIICAVASESDATAESRENASPTFTLERVPMALPPLFEDHTAAERSSKPRAVALICLTKTRRSPGSASNNNRLDTRPRRSSR